MSKAAHHAAAEWEPTKLDGRGDLDEAEVLKKCRTEYPNYVCFKETADDADRSIEERFLEFEEEKVLSKLTEHAQKRRDLFTSATVDNEAILTNVRNIKTAQDYRKERQEYLKEKTTVPVAEKFHSLGDVLMREVACCEEPRNTPLYCAEALRCFYMNRVELLPRKLHRYLQRWMRYGISIENLARSEGPLHARVRSIEREYKFCAEAIKTIDMYTASLQAPQGKEGAQLLGVEIPQPILDPSLFQVFMRDSVYQWKSRRRTHRFFSKAQVIQMSKRTELYHSALEHALGTPSTGLDGKKSDIPIMARTDDDLQIHLEELVTCFKVSGHDKTDSQEFFYNASKKFFSVFTAQAQSYNFKPYDLRNTHVANTNATEDPATKVEGHSYDGPIFVRHSGWVKYQTFVPELPAFVQEQQHRLAGVMLDEVLAAENAFLHETDTTKATSRLKGQSETHDSRTELTAAFVLNAVDNATEADKKEVLDGMKKKIKLGENKTGPSHRRQAFYLLRYIRVREFQRRLLDTLNYFRSVQRRITMDSCGFTLPHNVSQHVVQACGIYTGHVQRERMATTGFGVPIETYADRIRSIFDDRVSATQESSPRGGSKTASGTFQKDGFSWSLENREDSYGLNAVKSIAVKDHMNNYVIYDSALTDLEEIEASLLRIGSHYIARREHEIDFVERRIMIDRVSVLEDLYECETWFCEAKRKLLDCYFEAYEHCVDPQEQGRLAQIITNIIGRRPNLALDDLYFTSSYTMELVSLELEYNLLREIMNAQLNDERKLSQSLHRAAKIDDAATYGLPDPVIADSRLFHALLPGGCVVNAMELFGSLAVISGVPDLIEHAVKCIAKRFSFDHSLTLGTIRKTVLQEMIISWRLLGEEERMSRQLQHQAATDDPEETAVLLEDADALDRLITDIVSEEDVHYSRSKKSQSETQNPLVLQLYCNAMEAHMIRVALIEALYNTEIHANLHRKHGKVMGVNVRRIQLEPIDFEQRKTYAEIDEIEQTDLNEVVALQCEYLTNLSIAEFETNMATFDFQGYAGMKKLLLHTLADFRRALLVQVSQKNAYISVNLHNQQMIDYYEEGKTREVWQKKQTAVFVTQGQQSAGTLPSVTSASSVSTLLSPRKDTQILSSWPAFKVANEMDRKSLTRLFVSMNQIKSVHRKCVLAELNTRMAEILASKKPEQFRKKMKEMKSQLVHEYCFSLMTACYKYAAKWEINESVLHLQLMLETQPNLGPFFIFGQKVDIMRPTARTGNAELKKATTSTCMLARNGRLEDPRYLPHYYQVCFLDWEGKEKMVIPGGKDKEVLRNMEHSHTNDSTHVRTNFGLLCMLRILHGWRASMSILTSVAQLVSDPLNANASHDFVRSELRKIQFDVESVVDATDTDTVADLLVHKPDFLFFKIMATLSERIQRARLIGGGQTNLEKTLRHLYRRIQSWTNFSTSMSKRSGQLIWPNVSGLVVGGVIQVIPPPEERSMRTAYRSYIQRLVQLRIRHYDLEQAMAELDAAPVVPTTLFSDVSFLDPVDQNNYFFIGSELMEPYGDCFDHILIEHPEDRAGFIADFNNKWESLIDEVLEDAHESRGKDAIHGLVITAQIIENINKALIVTMQRNLLKNEYVDRLIALRSAESQRTPEDLEETFQKNIVHRGKVMLDKELSAMSRDDEKGSAISKSRRRARTYERELIEIYVRLLKQEITKQLIRDTTSMLTSANEQVTLEILQRKADADVIPDKVYFLRHFIATLMSRAIKSRSDAEICMFQIPETSIQMALETLSDHLREWNEKNSAAVVNVMEATLRHYQALLFQSQGTNQHLQRMRDLDAKALQRRVSSKVADEKFDLLFTNDTLRHENTKLKRMLLNKEDEVRTKIRSEFEAEMNQLKGEIVLLQGQFSTYKTKLYQEMQAHLSEIKSGAMMKVGKMEDAPLHMRRQMFKIAQTDEVISQLKEQNNELQLTVAKLRLWNDLKVMNLEANYKKMLQDAASEVEEARTKHWGNKQILEREKNELKGQLQATQNQLSVVEVEVEQLRKDLQLQTNKQQNFLRSKVDTSKVIEDLTKKLKKYERWAMYDIDKLLSEAEARKNESRAEGDHSQHLSAGGEGSIERSRLQEIETSHQRELTRLTKALTHEKTLKSKAFEVIDSLRQEDNEASEAYLWQRKYFECSAELQRVGCELETVKKELHRMGLSIPTSPTASSTAMPPIGGNALTTPQGSARAVASANATPKPKISFSRMHAPPRPSTGIGMISHNLSATHQPSRPNSRGQTFSR